MKLRKKKTQNIYVLFVFLNYAIERSVPKTPAANGVGLPSSVGIDVDAAALADMAALNVWDHLLAKRSAIQLAVDAALTILKVDQIIMARRAGGPKAPQQGQRDADDWNRIWNEN